MKNLNYVEEEFLINLVADKLTQLKLKNRLFKYRGISDDLKMNLACELSFVHGLLDKLVSD